MTAPTVPPLEQERGRAVEPLGQLPAPVRRRRPWLVAVALLLGLIAWLVVAAGLQRASERMQVWSLATDVARGETVELGHLVATEISVSSSAGLIEVTDARASQLAGGVWAADLPAGTLVADALILDRLGAPDGQVLVGLALSPGQWPSTALRAGDAVMVIRTGDPPAVLVGAATVDAVTQLGDAAAATRLVTVAVPIEQAVAVSVAAAAGDIRLVALP